MEAFIGSLRTTSSYGVAHSATGPPSPGSPGYSLWLSDGWLSDHANLPRDRSRRKDQCLKIEPSPQDRLSTYGGSLATGSMPPRLLEKDISTEEIEEGPSASRALNQLAELRQIVHLRALVERPVRDPELTANNRQRVCLCTLQFIASQKTLPEIELGFRLLAAATKPGSAFRDLLEAQADPFFRDANGNTCLHLASTGDNARLLLQFAPSTATALNWALQSPLEALIARRRNDDVPEFGAILKMYRHFLGRSPFYIRSQEDGKTPCSRLTATERSDLDLAIAWPAVESALLGDARSLLWSVRSLWLHVLPQPADAADGALHFLLFEEECSAPTEHPRRLRRLWGALRPLLYAGCGLSDRLSAQNQEAGCMQLARWLLSVSKGADGNDQEDPRAPYRQDLVLCVAELSNAVRSTLDTLYKELVSGPGEPLDQDATASPVPLAGSWLCNSLSRELIVPNMIRKPADGSPNVLRNNLRVAGSMRSTTMRISTPKGDGHKGPLFELASAPAWLHGKDVQAALEDMRRLGSHVDISRLTESVARFAHAEDDLVGIACAWLHVVQLRRVHEMAQPEVHSLLKEVLDGPGLVEMTLPDNPRLIDEIWNDAQQHLLHSDRSGEMQESPADFVCDISHASAIYENALDLRECYKRFAELDWKLNGAALLRATNGFSAQNLEKPVAYPSVKLWIALQTSGDMPATNGVVVVQIELHLRAFHEKRDAALLLSECWAGAFELPHLHDGWVQLLESCAALLQAERGTGPGRLERAITSMQTTLKVSECQLMAAWSGEGCAPLQGRIAVAEQRLHSLRAEERILRESQDRLDTRYSHLPGDGVSMGKSGLSVMGQAIAHLAETRTCKLQRLLRDPEYGGFEWT